MAIVPRNPQLPVQLNLNARGLKPSATLAANEKSNQLCAAGGSIYKLGLGQSPFPVPDPVVEALRANAFQKDYLQVKGLPGLRAAVAGYRRRRHGTECTGEDVLIGPGSKPLMFLLQLVYYGDLVIPTPSWCSYAPQAHIIGRHVRWLNTRPENGWRLTSEDLEELCKEDKTRPRIVILNYPSNPTGGSYSPTELKAIAQVARANGVILLSDEIYGELHHAGKHDSIARFYPEGTIISSGLSKWCGAGGWRLGTFIFPPGLRWLLDAMANVASETYTSTSAPIQYAAVRAFQGGLNRNLPGTFSSCTPSPGSPPRRTSSDRRRVPRAPRRRFLSVPGLHCGPVQVDRQGYPHERRPVRPTPGGHGCRCPVGKRIRTPARRAHGQDRIRRFRRFTRPCGQPGDTARSGVGRKVSPELLQTNARRSGSDLRLDSGMTGAARIPSPRRILFPSPIQGTPRRVDPREKRFSAWDFQHYTYR